MKKEAIKWNIKKFRDILTLHDEKMQPIECIYKNPVLLPHPQITGQMVIKSTLCNTNCPMFDLSNDLVFGKLTLHCTGRCIDVYRDDLQQTPNPIQLSIS